MSQEIVWKNSGNGQRWVWINILSVFGILEGSTEAAERPGQDRSIQRWSQTTKSLKFVSKVQK